MTREEKRIATMIERYGVTNAATLESVQQKRRQAFENKRTTILFYQEPRINNIEGSSLTLFRLDKEYADTWLTRYHPFGAPRGNVLCLGLVKDDQVYCMMTFKKSRDPHYTAELSRMWMLPTYNVTGGYDILSTEASNLGINSIIAYVNLSFENADDYESIGMKPVRDFQRVKWWIKNEMKMSDASRRQRQLSEQYMQQHGWSSAYDCGRRVYVFQ